MIIKAKYSEAERRQYEESKKDYWDYYSTMKTARQKGIEEGMEKGMKKGMKKGMEMGMEMGMEKTRRENARKMKSDGMPAALIEKYTGLSADDINSL